MPPPEAFGGSEPTASMDIYSLGATLYALLLGRAPRSDKSGAAPPLARLLFLLNDPLPLPEIAGAQGLMPVIWRATAYHPADRYPSAAALRDDLALVRAGRPAAAAPGAGHASTGPFTAGSLGFPPVRIGTRPPAGSDPGGADRTGTAGDPDPSSSGPLSLFRPSVAPTGIRPPRHHGRWIGAAAAVVALLSLIGGLILFGGRSTTAGIAQAGAAVGVAPRTPVETDLSRLAVTSTAAVRTTPSPTQPTPSPTSPSPRSTVPSTTKATATPVVLPAAGSCWGGLVDISGTKTATEIPCAEAHYWEAYAIGRLDPATATPYDDDVAKDKVVKKTCTQAALKAFLGASTHGTFNVDVVPPRELAFAKGDLTFYCVVSRDGAGEVTGSMRAGR